MKGLLLKDLYMIRAYCRSFILIAAVFIAVSFTQDGNMFFVIYPCILASMIPVTLLSYDEKSHWILYSGALPCSRAQQVSAKYLIGLIAQIAILVVSAIGQAVRMASTGTLDADPFTALLFLLLIVTMLPPALTLPFVFAFGAEKGRIAYYVVIGMACAAGIILSRIFVRDLPKQVTMNAALPVMGIAVVGLYALSWYLSIVLYRRRDL